jgi:hypothetical protein
MNKVYSELRFHLANSADGAGIDRLVCRQGLETLGVRPFQRE